MLLQVRLIGDGTAGNPFRADLPTYAHIHGKIEDGYAIVSIDESVLGLTADDLKGEQAHPTTEGPLYTQLSADNLKKAQEHLDAAYPGKGHKLEIVSG